MHLLKENRFIFKVTADLETLTPVMRIVEKHGKQMLLCNVSGLEMDSIYFLENSKHVAEVSYKFNNCTVKTLMNSLHCLCSADSVIACDLANNEYQSYCYTWRCAAIHEGILAESNSVDVCMHVENNNSTKTTSDCSADSTNRSMDIVRWVVDEIHYLDTGILFPTELYNSENISSLIHSVEREDNGSILVCKVKAEDQLEWNIKILYPPALCSAYVSIHSTNQTCKLANGNPLIEVVRADNESSKCLLGSKILKPEALKLCDAVNRADLGAKYFVGNETDLFKLDILSAPEKINEPKDGAHICNHHLCSEGIIYSVVKKKRSDDTTFGITHNSQNGSTDNNDSTHSSSNDCAYSVVKRKKKSDKNVDDVQTKTLSDDCTYSVVTKKRRPDNSTLLVGKKRNIKERTDCSAEKIVNAATDSTYSFVNTFNKPGQLSENAANKDDMPIDYIYSFVNKKNITDDANNSIMHTTTDIITDECAIEKTS
ncbi:uncharacterized protein LOC127857418 [Dreissena polymorpha]|uniref:uncharacterized protein LOC127857418 n=1 Tax=Dreissena polymorpha TaxID=45954 RepID=UPI002264D56E|nr:uncharacterized protein LOC127857418 [Dreissena polymorpha]